MLAFTVCFTWLFSIAFALPLNTPLLPEYDYIIVGGGPSGLAVANRLSEDPGVNVLVLEAGPADVGEDIIYIPGFIGHDIGGRFDWNLSTVPQAYLDGNPRSIPQGRALGGGTLLNGMLWNRGGRADYDDWVQLGNPGWGWDDMLPYFKKSESSSPILSSDVAQQYSTREDTSVHGYDGPVNVSFPNHTWNASINLFSGLNELGVPTAYDPNAGDVAGASYLPFDIEPITQTRSTARRAYFDSVVSRPNLYVATEKTVTQVLFNGAQGNQDASTPISQELSVGQGTSPGMSDRRVIAGYSAQLSLLSAALQDRNRAVFELINANDGDLTIATMRPLSRGTLRLASSQPFTPPLIDPRYGSNPVDIQVLQEAIAFNKRLIATESMAPLAPERLFPPANASSDEVVQYIRSKGQTEYHPSGTAAMMPLELGGVVDPDLIVYGTSNLRIVDASILPLVPAAHLQAVVYAVAEKAADIIKAANNGMYPPTQRPADVGLPSSQLPPSTISASPPSPVETVVVTMTTFVTTYV